MVDQLRQAVAWSMRVLRASARRAAAGRPTARFTRKHLQLPGCNLPPCTGAARAPGLAEAAPVFFRRQGRL